MLDFKCTIRSFSNIIRCIEWILNAQNARTIAITKLLANLLLRHIRAAIAHPNTGLHIIELLAVELEELDEQNAEVVLGASRVNARMQLQERDDHENERVGADAARPHFVEVALQQELLEHHGQVAQARVLVEVLFDERRALHAVQHVEAYVDPQVCSGLGYFYDRHRGFVENFYVVSVGNAFAN